MAESEEAQKQYSNYINNTGYVNQSIIQIRLDTQSLLDQVELFLRGKREHIVYNASTKSYDTVEQKIGEPKCNEEGIQGIMSFVQSFVNAQVVQGNYTEELWRNDIGYARGELITILCIAERRWNIHPDDIEPICIHCMNVIKPFLTRLIANKERESYSNYSQSVVTQEKSQSGIMGFFGGKK